MNLIMFRRIVSIKPGDASLKHKIIKNLNDEIFSEFF